MLSFRQRDFTSCYFFYTCKEELGHRRKRLFELSPLLQRKLLNEKYKEYFNDDLHNTLIFLTS